MNVLASALLAGIVAIAVTRLVEVYGGRLGGVLGTLPTTIVPAAAGIWLAAPEPRAFATAMAAVPAGMLIDAGFLYVWRVLPPRLPAWSLQARLAAVTAISLGTWAALALGVLAVVDAGLASGLSPYAVGGAFTATHVCVGVLACLAPREAPTGRRRVGVPTLALRGAIAATAIGISVALAGLGSPTLAGLASVFPAIFLTTMVSLWWSQGEAVPAGAVGPMMLGGTAVSGYALLATLTFPWLGLGLGSLVAWVLAALAFTVPSARWLSRRAQRQTASGT